MKKENTKCLMNQETPLECKSRFHERVFVLDLRCFCVILLRRSLKQTISKLKNIKSEIIISTLFRCARFVYQRFFFVWGGRANFIVGNGERLPKKGSRYCESHLS